nr:glycosyltransferase family A protein [uncultured Flavobacterium sp.]
MSEKFTILIPTKNRLTDLKYTLNELDFLFIDNKIHCIICDDGSTDGTFEFVSINYPSIEIIKNNVSKGIHYARNRLLNNVKTPFALSIDDDAHFITKDVLQSVEYFFLNNEKVGLISFRAFWSTKSPNMVHTNQKSVQVKSFGAVSFAIRMEAWNVIPKFPNWFVFYGEEEFASFHLFKKNWQIQYLPQVLVHHRVDIKSRKNKPDYVIRSRRALRAGWYLFFLFYPLKTIPRKMAYSLWMQFKLKVFMGDFKALQAVFLALFDLIWNMPRILINSNRLTEKEYDDYNQLSEAKLYWQPEKDHL